MLKKIVSAVCALTVCIAIAGCGGQPQEDPNSSAQSDASSQQTESFAVNPLTGEKNIDLTSANLRPTAVMIDNDSVAQTYAQSGVSEADIVYETETEGGITRLMCVYKDITKAPQLGDIRSARYVYIDLAKAHNAIYVHSGKDMDYAAPHLKDIDNFEIGTGYYGKRITYGKVMSWQTLFTDGATLMQGFTEKGWKTTEETSPMWQNFADDGTVVSLSNTANTVKANFNGGYKSYFTYNAQSGNYVKTSSHVTNKDRNNDAAYEFKNVIIMHTPMGYYPGNYRREIGLTSGTGYYAVNGTYEEINWKKGKASDPIVFTKKDGTRLTMAQGNTWVCIVSTGGSATFE